MDAIQRRISDLLHRYARWCWHHAWWNTGIWLVAILAALPGLQRISVDADLAVLLSPDYESIRNLETLKEHYGGIGYISVLVRGEERQEREAAVLAIQQGLQDNPAIAWVEARRAVQFLEQRGLYFLAATELAEGIAAIDERIRWEKRKRNPFYIDLEESEEAPPVPTWGAQGTTQNPMTSQLDSALFGEAFAHSADDKTTLIHIKPRGLASNFASASEAVVAVEALLETLHSTHPAIQFELSGRFKKRVDQQRQLGTDLRNVTWIAFLLVLGYLVWHFRRVRALVLLFGPLLAGLLLAYGITGYLIPQLNIITAFIAAMLVGLGIDHGIHLLTRYQVALASGNAEKALYETWDHTAAAVLVAAVTTIAGFTGLIAASFRGFQEFGRIASIGMVCVTLAYLGLLPSLLRLIGLQAVPGSEQNNRPQPRRLLANFRPGMVLALLLGCGAVFVSFNTDFAAMEQSGLRSYELESEIESIVGYAQTPIILYAEDTTHAALVAEAANRQSEQAGSHIDFVLTLSDLVAVAQVDKQASLQMIRDKLANVRGKGMTRTEKKKLEHIRWMATASTWTATDLPIDLVRQFSGVQGSAAAAARTVLVIPSISMSDGIEILNLTNELRELPVQPKPVIAGEAPVLADILTMVFSEGPAILAWTILAIAIALLGILGSIPWMALALLTAVGSIFITLGGLGLSGLELNYLNIILIPVLLGMAADGTIHLINHHRDPNDSPDARAAIVRAIVGSLLTTGCGFGSLILADHAGLRAFGEIALIGTAAIALTTLLVLDPFLRSRRDRD